VDIGTHQRRGGEEQVRVWLGIADLIPRHQRNIRGQSERVQRGLSRDRQSARGDRPPHFVLCQCREQLTRSRQWSDSSAALGVRPRMREVECSNLVRR
jgi:hypothetical protein